MPSAMMVPSIFVSPEDVVWQEATNPNYKVAFLGGAVGTPSTVVPDLSISKDLSGYSTSTNDWRFSWMITAQQNNSANGAAFEGNIVVFENRPFSIDNGVVAGETVVEGVFGASSNVWPPGRAGLRRRCRPDRAACAGTQPSRTPSSRSAISSPTSPTSATRRWS